MGVLFLFREFVLPNHLRRFASAFFLHQLLGKANCFFKTEIEVCYKQVTDADSYDITVTLKGKESTTTYTGADALFENESYAYYKLSETPAYYITAWYNLLSGKWEFGKVHATETTVEGTTVELNTNGHHTTYEMKISGFDLDYKANKVYGVVLTTADGSEYGLHHVTNIWHGTKLGFNADDPYFASIIGKTITQITFYAADGVYVLPVNVAL